MRAPQLVILLFTYLLYFPQITFAQKIEFGKVPLLQLQAKSYEMDRAAGAVILSDVGSYDGNQLNRHVRIKIFKQEGLDWRKWLLNLNATTYEVIVFNLTEDGITKVESRGGKHPERLYTRFGISKKLFALDHISITHQAIQDAKIGSVIDIRCTSYPERLEWNFQHGIPVLYSEFALDTDSRYTYTTKLSGTHPVDTTWEDTWMSFNIPPFEKKDYQFYYANYITKLELQLAVFNDPGSSPTVDMHEGGEYIYISRPSQYIDSSSTWEKVIETLLTADDFTRQSNRGLFLLSAGRKIKKKRLATDQKILEAVSIVQQQIRWNGVQAADLSWDYYDMLNKDHVGTSADINLTLIALLNKAGIKTYPVVLSTRENGMITPDFPSIDKLNYVIGLIRHEGIEMFIDATSISLPPGTLPDYCLNGQGVIVKEGKAEWITLQSGKGLVR